MYSGMKPGEDPHFRPDVVELARARVAAGFYDASEVLDGAVEASLPRLWSAVTACPVGRGSLYRDAVAELLPELFEDTFDTANRAIEIGNCGARIDVELPLRLEALKKLPLWDHWASQYGIRSVLVEVKNEKRKAGPEDAKQLIGDLTVAGRGDLGLLVARRGFSRNAIRYMSSVAKRGRYLVIPLSEATLEELIAIRTSGPDAVCGALRSQVSRLLQAA